MALKNKRRIWIIVVALVLAAAAVACFVLCRSCSDESDLSQDNAAPDEVHLISNGNDNPLSDSLLCLHSTLLRMFSAVGPGLKC